MIEVKVKKQFGEFVLDAELKDEGFICLAGKNGSGKTVLLKIIAGTYEPDVGEVKIDYKRTSATASGNRGVVLVTPDSYLPNFDVEKHLLWGPKLQKRKVVREEYVQLKKALGINNVSGRVSRLSLGMRERVSLGTALLSSPEVILVDEAFANIDNSDEFIRTFREYARNSDVDVIFSTQKAEDGRFADHLYLMDDGRASRRF